MATTTLTEENSLFLRELKASEHHAAQTTELWRKVSYYVCIPGVFLAAAWVYKVEAEHHEHLEHERHENGGKLPEPPRYQYLNTRTKPFPWGMNTLFYNGELQRDMSEDA